MNDRLTKSYRQSDWLKTRGKLKNKAILTEDWEVAIQILKQRIFERYFEPLKILLDNSKDKGEGFTILTIECALIEFLATLEDGRIFKRNKSSTDSHCYYRKSAAIYHRFLQNTYIFNPYFSHANNSKPPFSVYDFYLNVRCALIHEAQTRNNWVVRIFKSPALGKKNKICFEVLTDGTKVIYRTALYNCLKDYLENFISNVLTQKTERGRVLRKHLARKIDHFAEIIPDDKFWWA